MTHDLSPEEFEFMEKMKRIRVESAPEPEGEFPGWLKLIIWLGFGALSWVPIFAVVYLIW